MQFLQGLALATLLTAVAVSAQARSLWKGKASFYDGKGYPLMSAAHRTLPKGTWVRVTDLRTGRSVVVVIADRGPFIHGRIIDLTEHAARQLGMCDAGVVPCEVTLFKEETDDALDRVARCPGRIVLAEHWGQSPAAPIPGVEVLRRKSYGWSTILMYRSDVLTASLVSL